MANFKIALLLPLFLFACPLSSHTETRTCTLAIVNSAGAPVHLRAEIADTEALRLTGLMRRSTLGTDDGMLFVFDREQVLNFWMKDTSLPLSIAYIGKDGVILDILDMKPFDISVTYPSSRPARYALEMNRGWFRKNDIREGCRLVLNGCIGK
jgi:uncharacterized membrane protein (UPF0127 family)